MLKYFAYAVIIVLLYVVFCIQANTSYIHSISKPGRRLSFIGTAQAALKGKRRPGSLPMAVFWNPWAVRSLISKNASLR